MNRFTYSLPFIILFVISCSLLQSGSPTPESISPTPTFTIGSIMGSDRDGKALVYVPAGVFTMGSEAHENEMPVHQVDLDSFWIDQTEVTNAQYATCVDAGACDPPTSISSSTRESYYGNSEFDGYPVIHVSWNDAKAYCEWAGRRLPTEAEWEKAARGTDLLTYPWGNDAPNNDLLNYNDVIGDTSPANYYPQGRSPYGALNMAGNLWEFVADWYSETYYASSPTANPLGPDSGSHRVMRGGSWSSEGEDFIRAARRIGSIPTDTFGAAGIRCAMSATP